MTTPGTAPAALTDVLAARTDALTVRALRAMYENPFWAERYGERGRRFAESDGRHHVGYLTEALQAGSPEGLAAYARWLQSVLVTRGMCSRHLAEHFVRLADAIRAEAVPAATPALDYLAAAVDALWYGDTAAGAIQRGVEAPAAARDTDGMGPVSEPYLASYLADAVALGRPEILADYVRWAAGHLARHGAAPGRLTTPLAALAAHVARLGAAVGETARPALEAAREAVRASPQAASGPTP